MKIVLENKDIKEIASLIASDQKDRGSVLYCAGGLEITVEYTTFIEGYMENDYFNGTGAYVVTSAEVVIDDIYSDAEVEVECDEKLLVQYAEDYIAA